MQHVQKSTDIWINISNFTLSSPQQFTTTQKNISAVNVYFSIQTLDMTFKDNTLWDQPWNIRAIKHSHFIKTSGPNPQNISRCQYTDSVLTSPVSKWIISKACFTMRTAMSFFPLLRPCIINEFVSRSTMGHCALRKRLAAYRPAECGRYFAFFSLTAM